MQKQKYPIAVVPNREPDRPILQPVYIAPLEEPKQTSYEQAIQSVQGQYPLLYPYMSIEEMKNEDQLSQIHVK